ncbi:MAG: Rieske 2Fe-2S domain-containing protein [Gemmatimonadaceae bacterium]
MSDPHDNVEPVARRKFLTRISLALGAGAAALAAIPAVAYVIGPTMKRDVEVWRDVGPVDQFEIGSTVQVTIDSPAANDWAGVSERMGAWLRRVNATDFAAFSINCTHLGCPVRWMQSANLFMCPCHGGVFYADGTVAAGPPEQPLAHHLVRVSAGRVQMSTRPIPIIS